VRNGVRVGIFKSFYLKFDRESCYGKIVFQQQLARVT